MRIFALIVLGALTLSACGVSGPGDSGSGGAGVVRHSAMRHIHGLDVSGGRLYIATHDGLYVAQNGRPRLVGESRQDLMGFSAVGGGRFVASGHPELQSDLPPHLGLIESRDAGRSWRSVSLLGEADFHALETAGDRVYGFDGLRQRLLVSSDGGKTWTRRSSPANVIDLAVHPMSTGRLIALTERGLAESRDAGRRWTPLASATAGLLAWPAGNRLFTVGVDGRVFLSTDAGSRWRPVGDVGGAPVALVARDRRLFVAFASGTVSRSTDDGRTWAPVVRAQLDG
jgi:photosystem II stability/assembly factor-like uncharacterized protein